jgi:hypothetical protein
MEVRTAFETKKRQSMIVLVFLIGVICGIALRESVKD